MIRSTPMDVTDDGINRRAKRRVLSSTAQVIVGLLTMIGTFAQMTVMGSDWVGTPFEAGVIVVASMLLFGPHRVVWRDVRYGKPRT